MKKRTQEHIIAQSMQAASGISGIAYEIIQQAKWAGCPAFKSSGRIDVHELQVWLLVCESLPDSIAIRLINQWETEVRPNLPPKLGIAKNIWEAFEITGLAPSCLLYLKRRGHKAFLD